MRRFGGRFIYSHWSFTAFCLCRRTLGVRFELQVLTLTELVSSRDAETGAHLRRVQCYCRCLAEEAARSPRFAGRLHANFIDRLEGCAALHDIGKAGLPDHILRKPGGLTPDERKIMETHTTLGAAVLRRVARRHGFARGFLRMARKHWQMGLGEMWRSLSKKAFVRALQRLVPAIRAEDLEPAPAGIRARC